jgi:hypothetical protein
VRSSILVLALVIIAMPAYGQEKRTPQPPAPAEKARLPDRYVPTLTVSVATPAEPGAVLTGASFVTGPSIRVGVQWSF